MISAAEVATRIKRLPIFPEAPARLAALMAKGNSGVDDFEKVIKPDPGLTANILRLANSAHFGLTRRVATAREAITLLGLKRVYDVATMAAMQRVLPKTIPGYEVSSEGFWRHSVAVASFADNLARAIGLPAPATVFTAGLMHDIGKLVLGEFLALHAVPILEKLRGEGTSLIGAEREILGLDHSAVGADVAAQWKLPEQVVAVIRWHHHPDQVPEGVPRDCVDLTHIADALAHSFGYGADIGELHRTMDLMAYDRLKLTPAVLEKVVAGSFADIEGLTALVGSGDRGGTP
jgi:putative nucleotidyltransferase with HDIG domain